MNLVAEREFLAELGETAREVADDEFAVGQFYLEDVAWEGFANDPDGFDRGFRH